MPAVTVAITTHNLERYLSACFLELERQTFQDFSVLVYDDCSTDGTRQLLEELRPRWGERLEVLLGNTPMRLPARSRNALLDSGRITGEYVVFLDGDDSLEPDFLEKLYTLAEETGADAASCAYDRVEAEDGHVLCQEMRGLPRVVTLGQGDNPSLAVLNTALWNRLIRVERIRGLRMPEFAVGEDASFLLAIYARSSVLAFTEDILIHYRVRSGSVISNTPEQSIYDFGAELRRLWQCADSRWMKDNVAFAAFIHMGLSMPMRAYDNPEIRTGKVLRWTRKYLAEYHWFRGNPYFRPSYLMGMGIKGLGIWGALLCHRLHLFGVFLWTYQHMVRLFHFDIKF